jgi:hypothetical protein
VGAAVFIGEGHLADRLVAGGIGITFGIFEGAEHPHLDIVADEFHGTWETALAESQGPLAKSCCCKIDRPDENGCKFEIGPSLDPAVTWKWRHEGGRVA